MRPSILQLAITKHVLCERLTAAEKKALRRATLGNGAIVMPVSKRDLRPLPVRFVDPRIA